uniref:7TM GPCR serpentine receptor class x (Srx) domain-containing protein n=1 Tax=Acrobeloides nanus TaxID=290746 RepID=A0A914E8N5_9BILA
MWIHLTSGRKLPNPNGTYDYTVDNPEILLTFYIQQFVLTTIVTVLTCLLEILAGIKFQKISKGWNTNEQKSRGRNEFKLYVHSVLMLLIQIIFLTYDTVNGIALFSGNLMLQTFVVNFFRWIQDLIIFGNSICLILIR